MAAIIDTLKSISPLSKGAKIPTGKGLKETNPEEANVDLSSIPGKIIIVGVPGAFTPPCSQQVPGYLNDWESFKKAGVQGIYVVAVNDQFTTQAWKEKLNGKDNTFVHFLADDTGAFTKSAGLSFDASGLLGNHRSQRYAAVVNSGVVEHIWVEDEAPSVTVTKAENVLKAIA